MPGVLSHSESVHSVACAYNKNVVIGSNGVFVVLQNHMFVSVSYCANAVDAAVPNGPVNNG